MLPVYRKAVVVAMLLATVRSTSGAMVAGSGGGPALPAVGVALFDTADAGLLPLALVAITTQVTAAPLARPVTVIGELVPLLLCAPQVAM